MTTELMMESTEPMTSTDPRRSQGTAPVGQNWMQRYPKLCDTRGILVTGSHRSGTTWVGRMLAAAPGVDYIHEPYKPGWVLPYTFTRSDIWFPYVAAHNASEWEKPTRKTLTFGYSWSFTYGEDPSLKQAWKATNHWLRWTRRRFTGHRPLMKDPIALFATPWLADRFAMDIVVMIRHPAAFCSSIKLKNWVFDWTQWSGQKELMAGPLAPFADDIARKQRGNDDIIDQAILQWRVFHHVIDAYRQNRPDWLYVRHEDLSLDPVGGYRRMYDHCKLTWTPSAEKTIRESSDEGNLKDAAVAGKSTHFVQLASAANVKNWQKRLSADDISRIRRGTEDVSHKFYTDADWA
ncbi:sulfotransferase family protein [Humisphaera borealis]|uniref:Sulfotransferase n=1 Tax=Humisphaera borealis TaxID=2807512 RepID=A0A7M2X237_9BACT|nr:sulfotransferase [Humisphaera borealis]QOV90810.1 sulfotransferase [Humisphaera borealis]